MKLFVSDSEGNYAPASDKIVMEAARYAAEKKLSRRGLTFSGPQATKQYIPVLLGGLDYEVFCVAYLDNRHKLIEFQQLFRGTIAGCSVHPREIVKETIKLEAAAVILFHNHPCGDPTPSNADELITRRIKEALAMIDVRLLDHIIVTGGMIRSMADMGLI